MSQATVVLGVQDPSLQESVLHFLERSGRVRVVGAADDSSAFERRLRESRPDAAVVSPSLLEGGKDLDGASLYVVAPRESTAALRTAIRAGARGFYLWPEEREALARDAGTIRKAVERSRSTGRVVGVLGARGGAGVTFLSTNLAAACARLGCAAVVVEADAFHGDVTAAIGVTPTELVRDSGELGAVADEMSPEHVERVLYEHPTGFGALLAPWDAERAAEVKPEVLARVTDVLRRSKDVVVLDLPSSPEWCMPLLKECDDILLMVTLDVLAFRSAKRVMTLLKKNGLEDKVRLVVNRAARAEVVPQDAERVFGLEPHVVFRVDRSIARAQNRGELVADRGGSTARKLHRLARTLAPEDVA